MSAAPVVQETGVDALPRFLALAVPTFFVFLWWTHAAHGGRLWDPAVGIFALVLGLTWLFRVRVGGPWAWGRFFTGLSAGGGWLPPLVVSHSAITNTWPSGPNVELLAFSSIVAGLWGAQSSSNKRAALIGFQCTMVLMLPVWVASFVIVA